jgi:hypothetical protein
MQLEEGSLKLLLHWFKGQPFSNVISFMQLALIAGGLYYGTTLLIPEERKAISELVLKQESEQTKQIERVVNSFEKALDRMSLRSTVDSRHGKDQ